MSLEPKPAAEAAPFAEPASGRWRYLASLGVGIASAMFILANEKQYVSGASVQIGMSAICAMPFLMGIAAGLFRPQRPIRTSLVMAGLALVGSAPLFGEGAACMIGIAPFYLVAAIIPAAITGAIVRGRRLPPGLFAILLLIVPALGTWVEPHLLPKERPIVTITDSIVVDAPREDVWTTVSRLELHIPDPRASALTLTSMPRHLLATILPRPIAILGEGVSVGAVRRVVFDNGTLQATVTRSEPLRRFDVDLRVAESGREFFDHWAQMLDATFTFEPLAGGKTLITHATRYRPRVFPRWYFEPLERYFAKKMQAFLLDEFVRQRFDGAADRPQLAAR